MSTLGRFRKPGGFQQLLALIETCDPEKQKNLMHLIGTEDPGWAHLVKIKALTFERIMTWPIEILMEITPHLQDHTIVMIFRMAQNSGKAKQVDYHSKWLRSIPDIKARQIEDMANSVRFTQQDQTTSIIKLLQTVRELESKGTLKFSLFDPTLEVDLRITA